jgi:hypothetical protein
VEDFVVGDGGFPGGCGDDCHLEAVGGIPGDVGAHGAAFDGGDALHAGEVDFPDGAVAKGFCQSVVSRIMPGDDEAAAGVFIQPMHDAGSGHSADAGERAEVVKQGVDQGAILMAGSGVDDHAGGFIEHGKVFILIEEGEGQFLRLSGGGAVFWQGEGDGISGDDVVVRLHGASVEEDGPFFDQGLDAGSGEVWPGLGEPAVEALARGAGRVGPDFADFHAACGLGHAFEFFEVGLPFLDEGVFPLLRFLAHVVEEGGVPGEIEQAHLAVAVGIEGGFKAAEC